MNGGLTGSMWRLLLVPVLAALVFVAAYFYFYTPKGYTAPPNPEVPVERLAPPVSEVRSFDGVPRISRGRLVVDGLHANNFSKAEASAFLGMVRDRGYEVEVLGQPGRFGGFLSTEPRERYRTLQEQLRGADGLMVAMPQERYTPAEAALVEDFVLGRGGRLLLVGDPTRRHELNTLAGRFGLDYQPDYLFNQVEYDLNFQNILVRDFLPDEITRGVGQIALYSTGSIRGPGPGLAAADGNTRSSMSESPGPFYPMLKAARGRVLALGDFTFMIPPRNSVQDNGRLLANIADFLTGSERSYTLSDFPHFFGDEADVVTGRPSLLDLASVLGGALSGYGVEPVIRSAGAPGRDMVYLGLYEDAGPVSQYLQLAGVRVDGSVRTPFTSGMDPENTGVIVLHQGEDRRALAVLADSEETLEELVSLLESGNFRDNLAGESTGVYRFE